MPPVGLQLQANLNMSQHTLDYGLQARQYDTSDFQDGAVKRIMNKLSDIERAGLPAAELEEVGLSRPETQSQSRVVWSCVVQMSPTANDSCSCKHRTSRCNALTGGTVKVHYGKGRQFHGCVE